MNSTNNLSKLVVGDKIKKLRISKGWKQKDLANKIGWYKQDAIKKISKIENGIQAVSKDELIRFAEVFGVAVEELSKNEDFPTEFQLQTASLFQGDLRIILLKIGSLPDAVSGKRLFDLLHHYCALKKDGVEL